MTKSLTSVLIGWALAEGLIDSLETPITQYLPELADGGYGLQWWTMGGHADRAAIRMYRQED